MPARSTVDEQRDASAFQFHFVCRDNLGGGVCSSVAVFRPSEDQAAVVADGSGPVPTSFEGPPPSPGGVVPQDLSAISAVTQPAAGKGRRPVLADTGCSVKLSEVELRSPTSGSNTTDVAGCSDDDDDNDEGKDLRMSGHSLLQLT